MIRIIDLLLFILGLLEITTGRLSSLLFRGDQHQVGRRKLRLLTYLALFPLPIAVLSGFFLKWLLGEMGRRYTTLIEFVMVLDVVIGAAIAFLILRKSKRPPEIRSETIEDESTIMSAIKKKAQGAFIYSVLGCLGLTALIACPLAMRYGSQAIAMIDGYGVGEQHRKEATLAQVIAVLGFLFYLDIAGVLIFLALTEGY